MVKLAPNGIFITVKKILSYVNSLRLHTWVKLAPNGIFISVKQILSYVVKLTLNSIFISVK